jgi:hypothetical protein
MRLAVVGSRNCQSPHLVKLWLDKVLAKQADGLVIISGGAKGVDTLATDWATANNVPFRVYLPDWDKYGKSAGFKRNYTIWDNADAGIAFWDGNSKGTAHSFDIAAIQGKPLTVVMTFKQRIGGIKGV